MAVMVGLLSACASEDIPTLESYTGYGSVTQDPESYQYLIGPGDGLEIFVWRNPEVSTSVTVRPDGKITTPLVEDLDASGRTPSQLARDIEKVLEVYIRQPIVTVIVSNFTGPYSEQIRVVGEATAPQALPFREDMTLLDVMILVGGLTEFAAGNRASIVRVTPTEPIEDDLQDDDRQPVRETKQYRVRIDDLLKDGDISANVSMLPGDILIIPESWF